MQEMILDQQEAHTDTVEQAIIESMRSDERILSIIVISDGNAVHQEMSNKRQPIVSGSEGQEKFHVTDLLSNIEYTVTTWRGLRLLSFTLGQHQIRATLQPDADIVEAATLIGSRVKTIVSSN